jgi:DNA-binding CsgD family transcriptional regulator
LASHDENHLLCNPVGVNIEEAELNRYIGSYNEIDAKWVLSSKESTVYRETDLIPDSREESAYYKDIYAPRDIHFSIFLTLVYNEVFQGIFTLYRSKEVPDFSEKDIFMLDMLKDHLSYRISKETTVLKSVPALNFNTYLEKYNFTLREFDIFKLLAEGLTNDEICSLLFISTPTAKKHIVNIYKKLNVNSRLQLLKLVK